METPVAPSAKEDQNVSQSLPEMPPIDQTFSDMDDYKKAKRAFAKWALEAVKAGGGEWKQRVVYFRQYELYKHIAHYVIFNVGDVPADFEYALTNVGPVNGIKIKVINHVSKLSIDGAVFTKEPTVLRFPCESLTLRNCTWPTPNTTLNIRCVQNLKVINPAGSPSFKIDGCCKAYPASASVSDAASTALAKLLLGL